MFWLIYKNTINYIMKGEQIKAIVYTKYGPPEVLRPKEVKKTTPGKNELCIKIHPTAVTANNIFVLCLKELIFLL